MGGNALGIQGGRGGEPYADEDTPEDEMAKMFADATPGDELDVPPEPLTQPEPDEEEDEELPQTQPEPPTSPEETGETQALVEPGTTEEEVETAAEEEERLLAGRFQKIEDLEGSYKELQGAFTRIAQDAQAREEREAALQAALDQQRAEHDQLVQMLTQQMAEQDPEFAERLQRQQEMQRFLDARLPQPDPEDERLSWEEQQEEQQLQELQRAAAGAITTFFTTHPEIKPGTPEDRKLTDTMTLLQQSGVPLALVNPKHIEIAYEASKDDRLVAELMMSPGAVNLPDGIDRLRARMGATIPATGEAPPNGAGGTQPQSPQRGPVRKRLEGFVETGSGGAPADAAPGSQGDEFDSAREWYEKSYGAKGPLFGSKR